MLLSRTMNTDCVTAAEAERSMPGLADDRVGAILAVDGASQLKVGQLCWAKVVGVVIGAALLLSLIIEGPDLLTFLHSLRRTKTFYAASRVSV